MIGILAFANDLIIGRLDYTSDDDGSRNITSCGSMLWSDIHRVLSSRGLDHQARPETAQKIRVFYGNETLFGCRDEFVIMRISSKKILI